MFRLNSRYQGADTTSLNKMQQYAHIYLLQNHSTCFGRPSRASSEVQKTVTAASGTKHVE
jgi:hypothetical protein